MSNHNDLLPPPLQSGRRLGEFVVREKLGAGGFADVYRATQPSLGRDAVIKVLRPSGRNVAWRLGSFEREARLASQLDHPYAAHMYAFGSESDGLLWIAMELVRGQTLESYLQANGPIPVDRFAPLFERLCEVVHTAHAAGLLHRDIKPANVMIINRAGRLMPKLLDFGIATLLGPDVEARARPRTPLGRAQPVAVASEHGVADSNDTKPSSRLAFSESSEPFATAMASAGEANVIVGTPAYMAPEQWLGSQLGPAVDVYALGVLCYRSLSGRLPFQCRSRRDFLVAHTSEPPPPLSRELGIELDGVVRRALEKAPSARFSTALELAAELVKCTAPAKPRRVASATMGRWLVSAPPPLARSLAEISRSGDALELGAAVARWVEATAQWLGAITLAASAVGERRHPLESVATLKDSTLGVTEWLDIARALTAPFASAEHRFPVPELADWFHGGSGAASAESLLTLASLPTHDSNESAIIELLAHLLRTLDFICDYQVVTGESDRAQTQPAWGRRAAGSCVFLADGDGTPFLELSPLVVSLPPVPDADPMLFVIAGSSVRGSPLLVAHPEGFLFESAALGDWLDETFELSLQSRRRDERHEPYLGLAAYDREDADVYFGRSRQVDSISNRVVTQPLIVITGPSGSGKSSLVQAGVAVRLGSDWSVISTRPGYAPGAALSAAVIKLKEAIRTRSRALLVIDQAEELFTMCANAAEREWFATTLANLAEDDMVRVVVTIRDDFLARADELPGWRERFANNIVLLSAPDRAGLEEMLVGPARAFGYEFEPGLADDMIGEVLDQTGALPLLSFAASLLWDKRDEQARLLSWSAYRSIGGVGGALATYTDALFEALPLGQRRIVRLIFRQLVTADGTRALALRDGIVASAVEAEVVVERLIGARVLVSSEGEDGNEYISIIHEALLSGWPRLVKWQADDALGLRGRDELRLASGLWASRGRGPAYLWRGEALASLKSWRKSWPDELPAVEQAFADASLAAEARVTRRRWLGVGFAFAALLLVIGFLVAFNQVAQRNNERAEARLTELFADRGRAELVNGNPTRALTYLHAALARGYDGPGMRSALALAARHVDGRQSSTAAHDGPMIVHIADSRIVTREGDKSLVWRPEADSAPSHLATIETGDALSSALSADGSLYVIGERDRLRVWELPGGELLGESDSAGRNKASMILASGKQGRVVSAYSAALAIYSRTAQLEAVLGDARAGSVGAASRTRVAQAGILDTSEELVAAFFSDGRLEIWNLENRALRHSANYGGTAASLAFTADDTRLLIGLQGGELVALDTSSWREIHRSRSHPATTRVWTKPDGDTFATTGSDGIVKIWSAESMTETATLGHAEPFHVVRFERGAARLATIGETSATIWEGQKLRPITTIDGVSAIDFTSERFVLGFSFDGSIGRWDLEQRTIETRFDKHSGAVTDAAFSPSRDVVASIGRDGIRLWKSADGSQIGWLDAKVDVGVLEWSPDGTEIFSTHDQTIRRWHVASGRPTGFYDAFPLLSLATGPEGLIAGTNAGQHLGAGNAALQASYLTVWDAASERQVFEVEVSNQTQSIALSPRGHLVAHGGTDHLSVFSLKGERLWSRPASFAYDVAFSPDGSMVTATVDRGSELILYDANSGDIARRIDVDKQLLALVFSPDGAILAAASSDGNVYLFEVASGYAVGVLTGLTTPGRSLDFSPSGDRLVAVDRGGDVLVWRTSRDSRTPEQLAALIEAKVPWRLDGTVLVSKPLSPEATK